MWAAGVSQLSGPAGLDLTTTKHGFQRTQLLKNLHGVVQLPSDTWSLSVTELDNHVPHSDTTYWCRVVKLPPALNIRHHIVKVGNSCFSCSLVDEASYPTCFSDPGIWELG